ncbi:MAG: transketolase, partial [Planctomycetes bacterium]|nr:transketolase [Planctomycetota bacterium]
LVSWGSTMPLCEQAAAALDTAGVQVDLIDLRSLSPWDRETVCASVRRTGKLLVVHEDNQTCGFGAEVLATVAESVPGPVKARRVSRPDTYVPCNFANQLEVLPSFKRILTVAAEMLDLDLTWELPARENRDVFLLEAQGSSPADQSVTVVSWKIRAGDTVQAGQSIADMEADKAVYDLAAPVDGVVAAVLVPEGQPVRVGTPLLRLQTAGRGGIRKRQAREESGTPILRRRKDRVVQPVVSVDRRARTALQVGLSAVYAVEGADRLTNEELVGWFPDKTPKDILKRTGIESRPRLAEGESALTLAVAAARRALEQEGLAPGDLSAVICSTTTPMGVTPSMACLVLHELGQGSADVEAAAHDVNAACSGYLYALAAGFDLLQTRPEGRVLILTTEALTRMVDPADFDTAILFGDAATATVLYGAEHLDRAGARLRRPVLSGKGEDGSILRVPLPGLGFLTMDGKKVFREALRCMAAMLEQSCAEAGRTLEDLAVIVPHQANGRIIDALRDRLRLPAHRVFNHIRHHGNTSSSSIPLALAELGNPPPQSTFGLCAFGGGFTYGAALLEATEGTRIQHG